MIGSSMKTIDEDLDMFGKKKELVPTVEFNSETQRAVLKCSICNGEQVAGFKDKVTGQFTEVSLIRNGKELDEFMEKYGLSTISKEY